MNNNLKNRSSLYDDISKLIENAHNNILVSVNSEQILLYWNIGKRIKTEVLKEKRAEYGKQIVDDLSKELLTTHGKGYSRRNLFNMIKFYEVFPDFGIVQTLSAQLSFSKFMELISIEDDLKREFYIAMCLNENWSVRDLKGRINSLLYERTALSKKPELTIAHDINELRSTQKMSLDLFLKDPVVLDFLGMEEQYYESDLEKAILFEMEKFILEMGTGFAFLARQKRITIDNENYYIDLLFYHRKLKRLVAIDLKIDKLKHSHKSQMELYLRWLEKYEMNEGENPPLGLILCTEKSDEMIELLELNKKDIHVAKYLTALPPKKLFEKKLNEAIVKARLLSESKDNEK